MVQINPPEQKGHQYILNAFGTRRGLVRHSRIFFEGVSFKNITSFRRYFPRKAEVIPTAGVKVRGGRPRAFGEMGKTSGFWGRAAKFRQVNPLYTSPQNGKSAARAQRNAEVSNISAPVTVFVIQ